MKDKDESVVCGFCGKSGFKSAGGRKLHEKLHCKKNPDSRKYVKPEEVPEETPAEDTPAETPPEIVEVLKEIDEMENVENVENVEEATEPETVEPAPEPEPEQPQAPAPAPAPEPPAEDKKGIDPILIAVIIVTIIAVLLAIWYIIRLQKEKCPKGSPCAETVPAQPLQENGYQYTIPEGTPE